MSFETIIVEKPEPSIARVVMNRPEARNAQNLQMTYDLNAAFDFRPWQIHAVRFFPPGTHHVRGQVAVPGEEIWP